jgi:hypothetical protein
MGILRAELEARPLSEWHEDDGPVLWWKFPIDEPPYVGTPLDKGAPISVRLEFMGETKFSGIVRPGGWPGYHTHWTPLIIPLTRTDVDSVAA